MKHFFSFSKIKNSRNSICKNHKLFWFVILFFLIGSIEANSQTIYFIDATWGNDSNTGTQALPFKTIVKGVSTLGSNIGTLYLRAGTYYSTSKISLTKTGQANNYIKIWAYSNEKVIVDFTGNTSDGFSISGSYYHLKGLDVRFAGHNGINVSGNNNIIENCITRNCSNTGLHLTSSAAPGPSNNLILNCDSFYNFDSPIGGNADGFSAKWTVGPGNIFRGCRAYNNSDDGWDLWMCTGSILIDSSYAFRNGVDIWFTGQFNGNGNGFKLGGNNVATPHIVKNCIAFDNKGNGGKGFDENNNLAGQTLYNCTSFRNQRYNYAFNNDPLTSGTHVIKNCISFQPGLPDVIRNAVLERNSWQGFTVSSSDFKSTDTSGVIKKRYDNGRIPTSLFLQLSSGSSLIDAGVDVGTIFSGSAPDLGAFEYSSTAGIKLDKMDMITQNYPNPFDIETTIVYEISQKANVSFIIINSIGRSFASFDKKILDAGTYRINLDTKNWEPGLYFYVIRTDNSVHSGKMIKN